MCHALPLCAVWRGSRVRASRAIFLRLTFRAMPKFEHIAKRSRSIVATLRVGRSRHVMLRPKPGSLPPPKIGRRYVEKLFWPPKGWRRLKKALGSSLNRSKVSTSRSRWAAPSHRVFRFWASVIP